MTTQDKIETLCLFHDDMEYNEYHCFKLMKHMSDNETLPLGMYDLIDELFDKYCK